MNLWREIKKHNEDKDKLKFVSLKEVVELMQKIPIEERPAMLERIQKLYEKIGKDLLERAILEKKVTQKEWIQWSKKGLTFTGIGIVLQGYYARKQKKSNDKVVVVSNEDNRLFQFKELFEKRFDIEIIDVEEFGRRINIENKSKGK